MLKELNEKIGKPSRIMDLEYGVGVKDGKRVAYQDCKTMLEKVIEQIESENWEHRDSAEECKAWVLKLLKGEQ